MEALEQAELLASLGYDYVELPLAGFDLTGPQGTEEAKQCVPWSTCAGSGRLR